MPWVPELFSAPVLAGARIYDDVDPPVPTDGRRPGTL